MQYNLYFARSSSRISTTFLENNSSYKLSLPKKKCEFVFAVEALNHACFLLLLILSRV